MPGMGAPWSTPVLPAHLPPLASRAASKPGTNPAPTKYETGHYSLRHGGHRLEPEPRRRARRLGGSAAGRQGDAVRRCRCHLDPSRPRRAHARKGQGRGFRSHEEDGFPGQHLAWAHRRGGGADPSLENRRIAGAAIDVYDQEPLPGDRRLRRLGNTVLTSHLGYVSAENCRLIYGRAVEAIAFDPAGAPIRVPAKSGDTK
jgi:hypothetical protein